MLLVSLRRPWDTIRIRPTCRIHRRIRRPVPASAVGDVIRQKMSVSRHTSLGDIKIKIFCEETLLATETFLALCASGYHDGTLFHDNPIA